MVSNMTLGLWLMEFFIVVFLQSSYKELISKVLDAFKPGRFLMTLFANEVSNIEKWCIK